MKLKYLAFGLIAYLLFRSRSDGLGRLVSGRRVPFIRNRRKARQWARGARQNRRNIKKFYRNRKPKYRVKGPPIYGGRPWVNTGPVAR